MGHPLSALPAVFKPLEIVRLQGVAIRCLQYAWPLYMEDHGLGECLVPGLLEEQVVALA